MKIYQVAEFEHQLNFVKVNSAELHFFLQLQQWYFRRALIELVTFIQTLYTIAANIHVL